jgi:hypothetical protein
MKGPNTCIVCTESGAFKPAELIEGGRCIASGAAHPECIAAQNEMAKEFPDLCPKVKYVGAKPAQVG